MTSPYLEQPLLPLTVTLSRLLERIDLELASEKLGAAEERRLRWRAELIRRLLTPRPITRSRQRASHVQIGAKR
jgi:hypothetical protein